MRHETDPTLFDDLPVFALNTVLFPGGVLPLRVFEARYMDMARDCLANDRPFGVCLIVEGEEQPDIFSPIGEPPDPSMSGH